MDKKGFRLNLLSQSLWGASPVVTKLISFNMSGSLLTGLRNGIGAIVMAIFVIRKPDDRRALFNIKPILSLHLFLLAIIAVAIPNILMVESIRSSGAIIAAMLSRLEIPIGVILAGIVLKEKISTRARIATFLSLLSVTLLSQTDMDFTTFDNANIKGIVLGLVVASSFALSTIYAKWIFNNFDIPSQILTLVRTTIGAICSLLIFIVFGGDIINSISNISAKDWVALSFLGVFVSAIAYLAYYKSLSLLDAHVTQIMLSVALVIAVILGLLIGESLSVFQWIGIALVAISIYLIQSDIDK